MTHIRITLHDGSFIPVVADSRYDDMFKIPYGHIILIVEEVGVYPRACGVQDGYVGSVFKVSDFAGEKHPKGVIPLSALPNPVKSDSRGQETPVNEGFGNPKHALGVSKLPLHLWPPIATAFGCLGIWEGLNKYGRNNYRATPVYASIYIAALKRHIDAYSEGEDLAPDSKIDHRGHMLACVAILLDAEMAGTLVDDRNFNGSNYRGWIEKLTGHVKRIQDLYKDKNPRHYTIQDNSK